MKLQFTLVLAAILVLASSAEASGSATSKACTVAVADSLAKDWIVKAADNICGLRDAAQLSNPVKVDFKALLDATPEMKKVRDEKIDPTSSEGIRLNNEAVNRIGTACETVRAANSYCSVWKEVSHKDGRAITDVTEKVKALL